jgi:hypothetical protein
MPGRETQHQSPLILQLVKNREEQRAANAQKNSGERDHDRQFFTTELTEGLDFESIMEWVGVFLSLFWLALLSGGFLFVWVFVLKLALSNL